MVEIFQNTVKVFFLVVIVLYLQHCFLGNMNDAISFQIRFNRAKNVIFKGINLV